MTKLYLFLDFVQKKNSSKNISKNSNMIGGSVLLGTPQEEIKAPCDENVHLLIQENGLNEEEVNKFILSNISNKYDKLDVDPGHKGTVIHSLVGAVSYIF